jgi:riboflavin biosynthesis pyrimidine reductase
MTPLERLYERSGLPAFGIPAALAAAYGGDLGFAATRLYANLVSSLDGVVTVEAEEESGHLISGDSESDRFVMALLRACADAILIGAGTFRKAPGHRWRAEAMHPSPLFAELRRALGLDPDPLLVVISSSGELDLAQPALADALIATTRSGAARLAGGGARLAVFDDDPIPLGELMRRLHADGRRRVLSEGGPTLIARLIGERLLDELFVTSAPALFGRHAGDRRKSLVDGADVARTPLELMSVRRDGSHLFLRYAIGSTP